jgi:hypothetical protein
MDNCRKNNLLKQNGQWQIPATYSYAALQNNGITERLERHYFTDDYTVYENDTGLSLVRSGQIKNKKKS